MNVILSAQMGLIGMELMFALNLKRHIIMYLQMLWNEIDVHA